ncbi:universal stress protein [Kineosporia babensis]|uniref:Universal stress protein n=1 Tax=Kineosporia babensis TaxID=499548 RepID=A0A9X1N991_9ACTN|nr:universal stress protein [Kineosporia babensis]MCD5309614.1 universal stress protein [Kineosporia babensis]
MTRPLFAPLEQTSRDVVVVGVSYSECSRGAIVFGADEAYRRGAALRLVQACEPPEQDSTQSGLDTLAMMIHAEYPWLPVITCARPGRAEEVLLQESAQATLMVLGSQECQALAGAAACPVIRIQHRHEALA